MKKHIYLQKIRTVSRPIFFAMIMLLLVGCSIDKQSPQVSLAGSAGEVNSKYDTIPTEDITNDEYDSAVEENEIIMVGDVNEFIKQNEYFFEYPQDVPDYKEYFSRIVDIDIDLSNEEFLIWSDLVIKSIDVVCIEYTDAGIFIDKEILSHTENIQPGEAAKIRMYLPCGIPDYKITLTGQDNGVFSFIPGFSGKDGSLCITPQNPSLIEKLE